MRYLLAFLLFTAAFAITINSCTTINTPGYYTLANNITANTQNCITINASNVTLDCKGFAIINNLTTDGYYHGVKILSGSNITINNCSFYKYYRGGIGVYAPGPILINDTYIDAYDGYYAIYIGSQNFNVTVQNSVFRSRVRYGVSRSIYIYSAGSNSFLNLYNNTFNGGDYGVFINYGSTKIMAKNNGFDKLYWYAFYSSGNIENSIFIDNNVSISRDVGVFYLLKLRRISTL